MSDAVRKAVEILQHLADCGESVGVRGLAERIGQPKSTTLRLLQTLESCSMVWQDPETLRYYLGERNVYFGLAYLKRVNLRQAALPAMRELRDATGETVGLNVRIGDARMYVEQLESPHQLLGKAQVGLPYPLHTGSPGRVLLAALPDAELTALLERATFTPLTRCTPADPEHVLRLVAETRERGYAIAFEETIEGLNTVAVPVRDSHGLVVAALSISGPAGRFGMEQMDKVLHLLVAAAARVSAHLGHAPALSDAAELA